MKCNGCDSEDGWRYLHSRCHTEKPTWVQLKNRTLVIKCSECEKTVATFLVEEPKGDEK